MIRPLKRIPERCLNQPDPLASLNWWVGREISWWPAAGVKRVPCMWGFVLYTFTCMIICIYIYIVRHTSTWWILMMSTRWFAALPSGTARVSHEAPKSSPVATPWWAAARLFINGVLICFDLHQLGMLIHWVPKCPQSWAQRAQPQSVRCASNNFHKRQATALAFESK